MKDLILAYFKLTETTISSIDEDDTSCQENTEHLNVQNNCLNSTPIDIYSVERRLSDNILISNEDINNRKFVQNDVSNKDIIVPDMAFPKTKGIKKMWTLEEDKRLIQKVLEITGLEAKEISSKVVRDNANILTLEFDRVLSSIVGRWRGYLQPIILSTMHGKLNYNIVPEVYKYLIESKVKRIEDIDWQMLVKRWPFQTEESLKLMVRSAKNWGKNEKNIFLYQKLKHLLPKKRKPLSLKDQEFNSSIATAYNDILKTMPSINKKSINQFKEVSPETKNRLPLGIRSQNVFNLPTTSQEFIPPKNHVSTPVKKTKRSWSLEEEKILIKGIFQVRQDFNASHINETAAKNIFPRLQPLVNRPLSSITSHWFLILQPLILSHIYGKLDFPITASIFSNLISRKVRSLQDVNWKELLQLWPFQNERSLRAIVSRANDDVRVPSNKVHLYEKLHVLRPYYVNKKTSSKKVQTNKEIIDFYEEIMLKKRQNAFKNL